MSAPVEQVPIEDVLADYKVQLQAAQERNAIQAAMIAVRNRTLKEAGDEIEKLQKQVAALSLTPVDEGTQTTLPLH